MEKKIIIVSEKRNEVYHLTDLIPEMMAAENLTQQQAINHFMNGLNGSRFGIFHKSSRLSSLEWIVNGKGNFYSGDVQWIY